MRSIRPDPAIRVRRLRIPTAQGSVPDDLLRNLLDEAYRLVLHALPKKKQREITGE